MLDKGPSPGSPAAAAFRQFWGDKAELRRFQVWLEVMHASLCMVPVTWSLLHTVGQQAPLANPAADCCLPFGGCR